jgi:hypothetical protein
MYVELRKIFHRLFIVSIVLGRSGFAAQGRAAPLLGKPLDDGRLREGSVLDFTLATLASAEAVIDSLH